MEVTEAAACVLKRAMQIANVDASVGGVRLRSARALGGGVGIQIELADGPLEGERVVETPGLRLFVDPGLLGTMRHPIVTLDPQHDTITLRDRDGAD